MLSLVKVNVFEGCFQFVGDQLLLGISEQSSYHLQPPPGGSSLSYAVPVTSCRGHSHREQKRALVSARVPLGDVQLHAVSTPAPSAL